MGSHTINECKAAWRLLIPLRFGCILLMCINSSAAWSQSEPPPEPEPPPPAEQSTQAPADPTERIWVDGFRDGVQSALDGTAKWIDGFFGERLNDEDYEGNQGRFILTPRWSEHDGFELDSSFRARLKIPHAKEQFSAVIGRGDFDDFVSGGDGPRPSIMRRTSGDDEWLVGLGFDPFIKDQHDLSFGAGIRGGIALDTYVRGRYRYETPLSEQSEIAVQTVGFWRDSDGFGIAQDLLYERYFSERWVARNYIQGTFAERTEGIRWRTDSRLYYIYAHERAVAAEVFGYGETRYEVPITDYGYRLLHRMRFQREWLFMESWVGGHWPKDIAGQKRTFRWMLGVEFEMHFGG